MCSVHHGHTAGRRDDCFRFWTSDTHRLYYSISPQRRSRSLFCWGAGFVVTSYACVSSTRWCSGYAIGPHRLSEKIPFPSCDLVPPSIYRTSLVFFLPHSLSPAVAGLRQLVQSYRSVELLEDHRCHSSASRYWLSHINGG